MHSSLKILAFVFMLFFAACEPGLEFNESYSIPNQQWHRNTPLVFKTHFITDTITGYNASVVLRNTLDYKYRNIYFFITIEMPNKKILRDTVNAELLDEEGNWKENVKGFGTIKEAEFSYRKFRFPNSGIYTFTVQQGMTDEVLGEVVDLGFKLKKVEQE